LTAQKRPAKCCPKTSPPPTIAAEVAYFKRSTEKSYERTYGWAWLLKLDEELISWDDPLAQKLHTNLQPLTDLIAQRYLDFLPKLNYAIRTGEHPNTAFGLAFAYDYALAANKPVLLNEINETARRFYLNDTDCPISWEPGGYDFLSPCLEEIDIMRRVLNETEFHPWLQRFLPRAHQTRLQPGRGRSIRPDGRQTRPPRRAKLQPRMGALRTG